MSQAGITRADKVVYLETQGWIKRAREHGAPQTWDDPVDTTRPPARTPEAYEIAKRRERGEPS